MITSLWVLKQSVESGFVDCDAQGRNDRMETFFHQLVGVAQISNIFVACHDDF